MNMIELDLTVLDRIGPPDEKGYIKANGVTDDRQPLLYGMASEFVGSLMNIRVNDVSVGEAKILPNGLWTYVFEKPLNAGQNSISLLIIDAVTKEIKAIGKTPFKFTIELPQQLFVEYSYAEDKLDASNRVIKDGEFTRSKSPTLHGKTATNATSIEIFDESGKLIGSSTPSSSGSWSYTLPAQTVGLHSYKVVAKNAKDSKEASFKLNIADYPATSILSIIDDTDKVGDFITKDTTLTINGKLTGLLYPDEKIQISVNDGKDWSDVAYDSKSSTWNFDNSESPFAVGKFTIKTRIINESKQTIGEISEKLLTIIKDTPTVPEPELPTNRPKIVSFLDNTGSSRGEFGSGTATDETNPVFTIHLPGPLPTGHKVVVQRQTGTETTATTILASPNSQDSTQWVLKDSNLKPGAKYTYYAYIQNKAGQLEKASDGFTLTIDTSTSKNTLGTGRKSFSSSVALGANGQWVIASDQAIFKQKGNDFETYNQEILYWDKAASWHVSEQYYHSAPALGAYTLADYNRDGLLDLFVTDRSYIGRTATMFYNVEHSNGKGIQATLVDVEAMIHLGGAMSIDMDGDGRIDAILGDSGSDSGSFLHNAGTSSTGDPSDPTRWDLYGFGTSPQTADTIKFLVIDHEVSGVDIDNDGTVDFVGHAFAPYNSLASDPHGLTIVLNSGTTSKNGENWKIHQSFKDVFNSNGSYDDTYNGTVSLNWADYNGDGYLDLFIPQGKKNEALSLNSLVFYNTIGEGGRSLSAPQSLDNKTIGNLGVAVDWDADGKMDIIRLPNFSSQLTNISWFQNQGTTEGQVNWKEHDLPVPKLMQASTGSSKPTEVKVGATGVALVDYDWDGALDLVVSTMAVPFGNYPDFEDSSKSLIIKNSNRPEDGTALHLRILSPDGFNVFYGNTVQLYDSSNRLVSTQIINPQAGFGSNDGTGLVHFYGLSPDETYHAIMFHNKNGKSNHFGSISSIPDEHFTINNINQTWGNLKPADAHQAIILIANKDSETATTTSEQGLIGTGYNDTFFAQSGTYLYNGGGGWNIDNGKEIWSATGGADIVDFRLAGSKNLTINLNDQQLSNNGFSFAKLTNIEGIYGAAGADTFIGNTHDNIFNGRGGNDSYDISRGGHNTILYQLLEQNNGTGGNGTDTIIGFTASDFYGKSASTRIDISELLPDFPTNSSMSTIQNYLKIEKSGSDSILKIDRDGSGSIYNFENLLIIKEASLDFETLYNNHQIII